LCELNSLPRTSFALLPHRRDSHHCNVDWNLFLFLLAWVGHALGGFAEYAADQVTHSQPQPAFTDYLTSARFWFESFQNWQSEFLASPRWSGWLCTSDSDGRRSQNQCNAPHTETGR